MTTPYTIRLGNVVRGLPASGSMTNVPPLGTPSDRGPSLPAPTPLPFLKKLVKRIKKPATPENVV